MKVIVCTEYRPPEVHQLKEMEKPTPKDNEVLIKIYTTTVSSGRVIDRSTTVSPWAWLPIRIIFGLIIPRRKIPGAEFVGEIEALGKDVKLLREGDQVFAATDTGLDAHAEYICLPEDGVLAIKPVYMT